MTSEKRIGRIKRKKRIRKKIYGTSDKPRLCIFRSSKHIYAQIIDDSCGCTLAAASTMDKEVGLHPDVTGAENKGKIAKANAVGQIIGSRAIAKGLKKAVFDRNGFLYHGRIKAVSDGARKAGLEF